MDLPQELDLLLQRFNLPLQIHSSQGGFICLLELGESLFDPRVLPPTISSFVFPLLVGVLEAADCCGGLSSGVVFGGLPSASLSHPTHLSDLSIRSQVVLCLQPQVGFILEPGIGDTVWALGFSEDSWVPVLTSRGRGPVKWQEK